jgi:hypothetical protein
MSPLCVTKSISMKPGAESFQSANVRVGTLFLSAIGNPRLRRRPATVLISQQSVDRRGTHRRRLRREFCIEAKMPVAFECRHEDRQQRFQPYRANPIRRLPQYD